MIPYMPRWQSYIAQTTAPIFTPEQCKMIIDAGHKFSQEEAKVGGGKDGNDTEKRVTKISWIPFDQLPQMYDKVENQLSSVNLNHFMFDGIKITEPAQFTVYPEGGFYDWHIDNDVNFAHEPVVRKISMTCLLSPENQFEGGDLELMREGKPAKLKQGHAIFFASFIRHRVTPVIRGNRKSLVMWFGGTPLR